MTLYLSSQLDSYVGETGSKGCHSTRSPWASNSSSSSTCTERPERKSACFICPTLQNTDCSCPYAIFSQLLQWTPSGVYSLPSKHFRGHRAAAFKPLHPQSYASLWFPQPVVGELDRFFSLWSNGQCFLSRVGTICCYFTNVVSYKKLQI